MTVIQRPVKGSRISSFYPVHELPRLASLDSAFQLQEYISLLIRLNVHDVDAIVSIPGKSGSHERDASDGSPEKEGKNEVTVDESCWVYEQLRRLAQDLSHPLITTLQQECTRQTCPEMKAGEWLYLCVAHGNEGAMEQCCAIDYILHTLDSATALLNSPRAFPSRLSIPPASTRHFPSLARRLGRIFAHAYYHHREAFEQAEAESSLYARFLALTSKFALVPTEFLVIPPRMNVQLQERDEDERDDAPHDVDDNEEPSLDLDLDPSEYMNTARRVHGQERLWLPLDARTASPPRPADDARNPSPRKGRSRTDTMVYSEAVSVAEELARSHGLQEAAELGREVARERRNAYSPPEYPSSQPASSQRIQFEDLPDRAPVPGAAVPMILEHSVEHLPVSKLRSEVDSAIEPEHEQGAVPQDETPGDEQAEDAVEDLEEVETTEAVVKEGDETGSSEVEPHPEEIEEVDVTESAEHQELVEESSPPTEHVPAEADTEPETEEAGESKEDDSPNTPEDDTDGGNLDDIPDTEEDGTEDAARASADKEEEPIEEGAEEEAHAPAHATTTEASESEDVATTDVPPADNEPKV